MRKFILNSILFYCSLSFAQGQNSASFYQLGDAVYQNNINNPSILPEGKLFIGLPGISGIQAGLNNKFSYDDFFIKREDKNQVDLRGILATLNKNNVSHVSSTVSLFHVGLTLPSKMHLSIYGNERVESDFLYQKDLVSYIVDGNSNPNLSTQKIGKTRLSSIAFREIGAGISSPLLNEKIRWGLQAKYLQGQVNLRTKQTFRADLLTDPDNHSLNLDLENATLYTSGLDIIQGNSKNLMNHLITNQNHGFSLGLGTTIDLNSRHSTSVSITDIGFIKWKVNTVNYTLSDTAFVYRGINLENPDNLEQTIQDSLINRFEDQLDTSFQNYTSFLTPKLLFTWNYQHTKRGSFVYTGRIRFIQGQMKMILAAGYKYYLSPNIVGTINVVKFPQLIPNLGTSLAGTFGPARIYVAFDQLINFDVTQRKAFDFRFGVNLVFGAEPKTFQSRRRKNNFSATRKRKKR